MGRPERKTVDYFPHLISDGKKMFYMEHIYGNDGYATWYKILESLAVTENHYLNLNNESDLMFLSAKCRIDQTVLIDILNDLSKLGEINKELWLLKIIWSEKFVESIQDAYSRRNNNCMTFDGLCLHLISIGVNISPPKIVKEPKVKESKIVDPKYNFKMDLVHYGFNPDLVDEWLLIRKSKRVVNTKTAFINFINEIEKSNEDINEILKTCIIGSWAGFKNEWLQNLKNTSNGTQKRNFETNLNAQRDRIMSEINVSTSSENATNEGHRSESVEWTETK